MTAPPRQESALRLASASGPWVLFATVLGSAMAAIDATVVGIALPAIGQEFGASLAELQWVVTEVRSTSWAARWSRSAWSDSPMA